MRAQRVLRKPEFDAAFAGGRRISDAMFLLIVKSVEPHAGKTARARVGLAVAAKTIGNAVARNRVRRTIRESFRLHQHALPAVDIVVSARSAAKVASNAQLRSSLETLWQKVAKLCAASSAG